MRPFPCALLGQVKLHADRLLYDARFILTSLLVLRTNSQRDQEDDSEFVFDIDTGEEPGHSGGFSVDATECGTSLLSHAMRPSPN